MAEHRAFPPSARRRALARAAGMTAASPLVVGAAACAAAVIAISMTGGAIATRLGSWLRDALAAAGDANAAAVPRDVVGTVVAFALPVLGAIAIAATLAHLAQTRAFWFPRRSPPGAPAADPMRATTAGLSIVNGVVIGAVTVGWLYAMAPRLANLGLVPRAGGLLVASFLATLAITWVVLGVLDALVRYAGYTAGLRMTREEQREDARLSGADPRWRARRDQIARSELPARDAVAGASVLVLGDGVAVAVSWDAVRRPVPTRTSIGRGLRATQLLGLARRFAIPVHREPALAVLLATDTGPIPEIHWARIAEVIAAVQRR